MTRETLQRVFGCMLAREAGTDAKGPATAAAARRVWQRLGDHVTPLIGDAGVAAICVRSLHLTQRHFPGLVSVRASAQGDSPFALLHAALHLQEPAVALEAAVSVFVTASELLASLVGEDLATRLLREAWPLDFAGDGAAEAIT